MDKVEVGAVEWVWVEGGVPAGSHREGFSEDQCIHERTSVEEAHAYCVEGWDMHDPREMSKEAPVVACPSEEVQDEAFPEVARVLAAPQSLEAHPAWVS